MVGTTLKGINCLDLHCVSLKECKSKHDLNPAFCSFFSIALHQGQKCLTRFMSGEMSETVQVSNFMLDFFIAFYRWTFVLTY
jgi:hypothetical protein